MQQAHQSFQGDGPLLPQEDLGNFQAELDFYDSQRDLLLEDLWGPDFPERLESEISSLRDQIRGTPCRGGMTPAPGPMAVVPPLDLATGTRQIR